MKEHVIWIICLGMLLAESSLLAQEATDSTQEEIVRAKIGIKVSSDNIERRAKASERIKPGDRLRIYMSMEFEPADIYVIYNNNQENAIENSM